MIGSVLLFVLHSTVHVVAYIVPRTLLTVLVKTPLTLIESCLGEQRTFPERDDLMEITCNWWNKKTIRGFGLVENGVIFPDPLYNGHWCTILGGLRKVRLPQYERSTFTSLDGETIHLDWCSPAKNSSAPNGEVLGVMLILPGLTSSSSSNYIAKFVHAATSKGFACCVLNARGVDNAPLSKPQLLSAVWTTDVRAALASTGFSNEGLTARFGKVVPIVAVGFSLGGAILSKFLGEEGKAQRQVKIAAATTICAPWDMHLSANTMRGLLQQVLYQPALTRGLKRYVRRHEALVRQIPSIDATWLLDEGGLSTISTVQDFDRLIIAPHFGFDSAESYYTAATTLPQYLVHCPVPMLCIAANGDPVTNTPPLRRWESLAQSNEKIVYVGMPTGGHLGFVGGPLTELSSQLTGKVRLDPMEDLVMHAMTSVLHQE